MKPKAVRRPNTEEYMTDADHKRFIETLKVHKKEFKAAKREKRPLPRIPEFIGWYFKTIAEHLAMKPCYNGYSYKESMISDGIENCLLYFKNYDTKKTNPFAYFTTVINYAFYRRIKKENTQQYIKYKVFAASKVAENVELELSGLPDDLATEFRGNMSVYSNIHEFIEKFETKQREKKAKVKKTRELDKAT